MPLYKSEIDRLIAGKAGKDEVILAVVRDYNSLCYSLALALSRNKEEAEDILGDSMYKAYVSLGSYRINTNFRAWIKRIVVNTFMDRYRRNAVKLGFEAESLRAAPRSQVRDDPADLASDSEAGEKIREAIKLLPPMQRAVMVMHDIESNDDEEIAEVLGKSRATVRTHLFLARKRLREILKPYMDGEK